MRIHCIGGGPGGLYFALLMKKSFPLAVITVHERNRSDDTFGWGVVFSDETLGGIREADPECFAEIEKNFAYWTDIDTEHRGEWVRSSGHGFCGLSRKRLLEILQARAQELGVELCFEDEVDVTQLPEADLILACDGVNSAIRELHKDVFKPSLDWRKAKFTWLGTTLPLEGFTFIFKENEHGLFQVHAYPFEQGEKPLSTFIVECHEDVWRRAGLDKADEATTVAYMQELFRENLAGHPLLTNRSIWRTFPTVRCEQWSHGNIVLLGDAVHTAHFSIGSGTKLAMEDAIALRDAFVEHGTSDLPAAIGSYVEARQVEGSKIQHAAQTSLEWFENAARYMVQDPLTFAFNLMTRSKRITYDNLALRDPELVKRVAEQWATEHGLAPRADGEPTAPMFTPYQLAGLRLANRVVVSPMCQYSATEGTVGDWHLMHLGARAVGGAGLVITEMTNVSAEGRITPGCAGLYTDEHVAAWKRITDFVHEHSEAPIAIQLAHAGRKASTSRPWEGDAPLSGADAWPTIGPSALPFDAHWPTPKAMDEADLARVQDEFVRAAERALEAGFDAIELHMAHGYLLSSFLSPASNQREDQYGGSLENRMRYPLQVLDAVRAVWPAPKPLLVRISATDWLEDNEQHGPGMTADDALALARALAEHGCDLVDVSTAGNTPESKPVYGRMYQVPFAERIKYEAGVPVMAVGAIQGDDHVNTVILAQRADLCALARPHLLDPQLTLRAAAERGHTQQAWPKQYLAVKPKR
ncbi:MAG: anthraniloyl-CoA monooxygenase [Planctomycetota bacterium]|jgi:anthraniloyl-CoA monooxygenase